MTARSARRAPGALVPPPRAMRPRMAQAALHGAVALVLEAGGPAPFGHRGLGGASGRPFTGRLPWHIGCYLPCVTPR